MSESLYSGEETSDPANNECKTRNKNVPDEIANFYRDTDIASNASKKSQDLRLHEIEEQLEVAENRCNTLKGQLDSMKQIYHNSGKVETPRSKRRPEVSSATNPRLSRAGKKRSCSPKLEPSTNHLYPSINKKRSQYDTHAAAQKSSSSSTGMDNTGYGSIMRQASSCIGTDNTGAAVKTINNMLSGITDSFNRCATAQSRESKTHRRKSKHRSASNDPGGVYEIPKKPFSPRVEKRLNEQQKKVEEIVKFKDLALDSDVEKLSAPKESLPNVKTRSRSAAAGTKKSKAKKHSSSDSVSSKKHIKSTAKHAENTTKMRPVRTSMVDEESQMVILSKKRKRPVKRLKQISKVSLGRKYSDNDTESRFQQFTTENLVELYHNVAAKESDSDASHEDNKNQTVKVKGGGDLQPRAHTACETITKDVVSNKAPNKIEPLVLRALSPIEEQRAAINRGMNNMRVAEYYNTNNLTRNYEMPTISSTLKHSNKCYLNSFNFRSIPFCAAKSTSPSHNIGINIQQVMSIIKARRPMSGISPTLAHNITLAAGKLPCHPLKAFVSNLSSRIGLYRTACPLNKYPIDYTQLQELAREIPEESENEQEFIQEDQLEPESCVKGPSGDTQEYNPTAVWTTDPATEERCTCIPQKGVSFSHVLSKYKMHPEPSYTDKNTFYVDKSVCYVERPVSCVDRNVASGDRNTTYVEKNPYMERTGRTQRPLKPTRPVFCTAPKQRSYGWIRGEAKTYPLGKKKSSESKSLEGKEKNLKAVLKNLHDEFDALNTKYENMAKQVNASEIEPNEQTMKELEEMETQLNKKEEEINMVMSLYTEVMALKDQVKKLRERTSQQSVSLMPPRSKMQEPNAALHLTQLLKQIQNYQECCKNKKQFA